MPYGSREWRALEQVDLHNRLSVWGAPFHVIIALTGAYFGLVSPLVQVAASADHGGDEEAVMASIFGGEPSLEQELRPPAVARSLRELETIAPEATPIRIVFHGMGTQRQFFEIFATHPGTHFREIPFQSPTASTRRRPSSPM